MEIKDLLSSDKLKELSGFRETQEDSAVTLRPEVESEYHKVAETLIKTHGKGFIRIRKAKNGAVCGMVCFKISYKFRVKYPGVMEVYNTRNSYSLEYFLSQMKSKFNKRKTDKENEHKNDSANSKGQSKKP